MDNGLVSIIMPSFNTAHLIKQSIDSVLSQTYTNFELIIVDDCSTDNIEKVIAEYSDKRIVFYKNQTNIGAAGTRNFALTKANGKWVAFLDSDDLWEKDKLEKQVDFMVKNGYSFSYTNYQRIDEKGDLQNVFITGPKKITKRKMNRYCWVGCLTVMYDREKVGLIQIEKIRKCNDYAMWLKVIKKADCYLLDECLAKYRRGRTGSISSVKKTKLISWFYKLHRYCQGRSVVGSVYCVARNLFFGVVKKFVYEKRK